MGQVAFKYLNDPETRREYYGHVSFPVVNSSDLFEFRDRCFRYVTYHRFLNNKYPPPSPNTRFMLQKSAFETLLTQPGTVFSEKDFKNLRLLFAIFELRFANVAGITPSNESGTSGVDLRVFCSALAAFVDKPLSDRIELCFQLFNMVDDPKNHMTEPIMEGILIVVAEFVQAMWEEGFGRPHYVYAAYYQTANANMGNNPLAAIMANGPQQQQPSSYTGSRQISSARNGETVDTSRSTLSGMKPPSSARESVNERSSTADRGGGGTLDLDGGRSSSVSFDEGRQSFLSISSSQSGLNDRQSTSARPSIIGSYTNGSSSGHASHQTIPGINHGSESGANHVSPAQPGHPMQSMGMGYLESLTDDDRALLDNLFYTILDPLR